MSKCRWRWVACASLLACSIACNSSDSQTFDQKADWAADSFPSAIMTQETLQSEFPKVLLVDTRTVEEYAISHLPGAINWPDYHSTTPPDSIRAHLGESKPVVFYCSIGYRSGEATVRAASLLGDEAKLYNLRGGIFQWANEGRALEGGTRVHGYDEEWERLLKAELRFEGKKTR